MLRLLRWLALGTLVGLALSSFAWGPLVLRRVPWFEVRRVEISGTGLLAPESVLAASGIRRGQNIWDDAARWEAALRAQPGVAGARITRRIPGTLRVRIEEKRPVALVEAGTLRPATVAGELLPLDPARAAVDLPVVRGRWDDGEERTTARRLLAEVDRLARLDPGLVAEVSEIRSRDPGGRILVLSHRLAEITLPAGTTTERLRELRAVLADLERRLDRDEEAPSPLPGVDLRFRGQIVVRLSSSV